VHHYAGGVLHRKDGVAVFVPVDSLGPPNLDSSCVDNPLGAFVRKLYLPPLICCPVPTLPAEGQPFLNHRLSEHGLVGGSPQRNFELILEELLDPSHRNLTPTVHLVLQLPGCFKVIPCNINLQPFCHSLGHLHFPASPGLGGRWRRSWRRSRQCSQR
jgi:hypothetical protein